MKKGIRVFVCLLLLTFLTGCGRGEEPRADEPYIFYVNTEGNGLVKQPYEWKGDTPEQEVSDMLKAMSNPEETIDFKSAIPKDVIIKEAVLEEGKLSLNFGLSYYGMPKSTEVLLRAAIVQSIVQISGVDFVEFLVDGTPLADKDGNAIGYMHAEDFVQNIGPALNSYQMATLKLYYANETGDRLAEETVSVRYNSNMSMEKLVVEQLLKGPSADTAKATIPPETRLIGVSVKDGICYVNFDEGFLSAGYDMDPKIAIYSLVNSITESGNSSQVQISVNGETNVTFQGAVDLSKPIARDLDLIEESVK